ncbi:type I restriction endonuclease [Pedobacter aquatilis]|uniref:type I restriction endonuclease n=1 Tax=Pedobacter aquatilis TaxID=351343 RepID=UPI00292CEE37|nr:type I restriction endonuclease [Pedobacter aquatilis]
MELKDEIGEFAVRIKKMLPQVQTEDLTRNALVMPFIQILGYDVFNPSEVQSEAVVDFGVKKSKKVDYTIMKDGEPTILVECKHHEDNLDINDSRLSKYFRKTKAKYGLLTNGLDYRFYTEKMVKSKKNQEPLFEFNIKDMKAATIAKLLEEHKDYFNVNKENIAV